MVPPWAWVGAKFLLEGTFYSSLSKCTDRPVGVTCLPPRSIIGKCCYYVIFKNPT